LSIELLRKLGVYIDQDFLADDLCEAICTEIDSAAKSATPVYSEGRKANDMDTALRRSYYADVPEQYRTTLEHKIKALQPVIEQHFAEEYHADLYEHPKFVLYERGHYFAAHRDSQLHRKINMTIYLNDERTEELTSGYSGGQLILYELFSNPKLAQKGIALTGNKGMLVAYPAEIPHEVTPVIDGKRYAVVSRFLDQDA
jgi:predicted 2-oxoglutarate/Fe(II)-dependent dioxygenase YbiX